jgi:hypothetical protein
MNSISVDSINYCIFGDGKAAIESCDDYIATFLPRNCVAINGHHFSVAHLRAARFSDVVKAIMIPHSLYTIFGSSFSQTSKLEYLIFESESELYSISDSTLARSRLRSLFLPPTLRFLETQAFSYCHSVACVHFGHRSSLSKFPALIFSGLNQIYTITIPSSVKCIGSRALCNCPFLRTVQFELPSQCWHICATAFRDCPLLEPISLPSSVEFIELDRYDQWDKCFPFLVNGHNFLIRDDCLIRANAREILRYLGSSETFCVGRDVTVLGAWSFRKSSPLTTLDFELPSRVTHLLQSSVSECRQLRSVAIPKSVRFIGESCFSTCTRLEKVVFESPARVQMIESSAFFQCHSLTSFTVPSSVSTLGKSVFSYCSQLTSVTFDTPSQLTTISDELFGCCESLRSLTLPDSVTSVSPSAFQASGVTSIIGSDWTLTDGLLVHVGTLFCLLETPSSIRIPGSVREIGERAFAGRVFLCFQWVFQPEESSFSSITHCH